MAGLQGDTALLTTDLARGLLDSTEPATSAGSAEVTALRARPDVAVTVDRIGPPPDVLPLRGRVELTEVDGVLPEYARMPVRDLGPEVVGAVPGVRMVRIGLWPSWVGAPDLRTRFPAGFAECGR